MKTTLKSSKIRTNSFYFRSQRTKMVNKEWNNTSIHWHANLVLRFSTGIWVLQLSKTQTKFKYLEHLATSVEVSSNLSANWILSWNIQKRRSILLFKLLDKIKRFFFSKKTFNKIQKTYSTYVKCINCMNMCGVFS